MTSRIWFVDLKDETWSEVRELNYASLGLAILPHSLLELLVQATNVSEIESGQKIDNSSVMRTVHHPLNTLSTLLYSSEVISSLIEECGRYGW